MTIGGGSPGGMVGGRLPPGGPGMGGTRDTYMLEPDLVSLQARHTDDLDLEAQRAQAPFGLLRFVGAVLIGLVVGAVAVGAVGFMLGALDANTVRRIVVFVVFLAVGVTAYAQVGEFVRARTPPASLSATIGGTGLGLAAAFAAGGLAGGLALSILASIDEATVRAVVAVVAFLLAGVAAYLHAMAVARGQVTFFGRRPG